jgi:hypothetical protein
VELSYSDLMDGANSYLSVKLDLGEPVEIADFAAFFAGIGSQFDRYLAEHHPQMKGEAKMFVKEVRKGSIIADLVPSIPDLVGYMDTVLIVGGFGSLFSKRVRSLIAGQFIQTKSKPDIVEIGKTLRAISKDNTGDMTVESVELENGIWNRKVLLKFSAPEARQAEATLEHQKREMDKVERADLTRVLMTFEASRKSDREINKPTGELVVIEASDPKPKALIYATELVEQRIKTEIRDANDNIYKKGFIVDANVQMRLGRVVGYAVTEVHQVIDLPD